MEEFEDNSLKFDENGGKFSKAVENSVRKGDIGRHEQFLLFKQCFQNTYTYCSHEKTKACFGKG